MGKMVMFLGFVFFIVCIAGGVMRGDVTMVSTHLTASIGDADTTITVARTEGFPEPGTLIIGDERIAYSSTTDTTFRGNTARPLQRGAGGTDAVAHSEDAGVRTVASAMFNSAIDYNMAVLSDAAGAQLFIAAPVALFNLIASFIVSPFAFLGTDLQFITVIWGILGAGLIVALMIAMIGGRRV